MWHHGIKYGRNMEKVSWDLHNPQWFSLKETNSALQYLLLNCILSLPLLKDSKNLTQRKDNPLKIQSALWPWQKKHERKGEKKLVNSREVTPYVTSGHFQSLYCLLSPDMSWKQGTGTLQVMLQFWMALKEGSWDFCCVIWVSTRGLQGGPNSALDVTLSNCCGEIPLPRTAPAASRPLESHQARNPKFERTDCDWDNFLK